MSHNIDDDPYRALRRVSMPDFEMHSVPIMREIRSRLGDFLHRPLGSQAEACNAIVAFVRIAANLALVAGVRREMFLRFCAGSFDTEETGR